MTQRDGLATGSSRTLSHRPATARISHNMADRDGGRGRGRGPVRLAEVSAAVPSSLWSAAAGFSTAVNCYSVMGCAVLSGSNRGRRPSGSARGKHGRVGLRGRELSGILACQGPISRGGGRPSGRGRRISWGYGSASSKGGAMH